MRKYEREIFQKEKIDNFKQVNDDLGHDKGDQLLKKTADLIRSCIGKRGEAARLGGDEFIVITAIASNLIKKMNQSLAVKKN